MTKFGELLSGNIRDVTGDDASDAELKASLQEFGWRAEFPALVDESGFCFVGQRRMRIAAELGIETQTKTLPLGTGDAADAERVKLAIISNIGRKPMTPADRARIAERLYKTGEWSMERIGQALDVSKMTISNDLANCKAPLQLKPAKTASNPKGAGRPKSAGKPRSKFGEEAESKIAALVLDEGKSFEQAGAAVGVSNIVVRKAVATERGRRQERADPQIDPATLSISAQQKLTSAIRQHQRALDAEFDKRLQQRLHEVLADTVLPAYNKSYAEYQDVIQARKGVMDKATFNRIRRCLHPDSRNSVSDEKLREAFNLFGRLELRLLDESQHPTATFDMPRTYEELMARKREVQDKRRARRGQNNDLAQKLHG